MQAAKSVGRFFAAADISLVYGGGHVGLMGIVADACLASGGHVIGVITRSLMDREVGHWGLNELVITETMHERKAIMAMRADGFIVLPGGIGTMDELFEIWTWRQLGLHQKPIGLLNINGFFDPLLLMTTRMTDSKFLKAVHRDLLIVESQIETLIRRMKDHTSCNDTKWQS